MIRVKCKLSRHTISHWTFSAKMFAGDWSVKMCVHMQTLTYRHAVSAFGSSASLLSALPPEKVDPGLSRVSQVAGGVIGGRCLGFWWADALLIGAYQMFQGENTWGVRAALCSLMQRGAPSVVRMWRKQESVFSTFIVWLLVESCLYMQDFAMTDGFEGFMYYMCVGKPVKITQIACENNASQASQCCLSNGVKCVQYWSRNCSHELSDRISCLRWLSLVWRPFVCWELIWTHPSTVVSFITLTDCSWAWLWNPDRIFCYLCFCKLSVVLLRGQYLSIISALLAILSK